MATTKTKTKTETGKNVKVKVLKKFRDKKTKKTHKAGEELEITKERMEEILSKGEFVEEVKENESGTSE